MKRSFLFLTLVAFAMTVLATADIDVISRQWRESTLDVHGGGQSPDIIALLKAFNHKFPTPAVNRLIDPPAT